VNYCSKHPKEDPFKFKAPCVGNALSSSHEARHFLVRPLGLVIGGGFDA
jgi:hypothetical protein